VQIGIVDMFGQLTVFAVLPGAAGAFVQLRSFMMHIQVVAQICFALDKCITAVGAAEAQTLE